jgi:hypothetical protein
MGTGDLTNLANVKAWLAIDANNTKADALLQRLISSASSFVLNFLNRDTLTLSLYSEVYDGHGNTFMVVRKSPVWSVIALGLAGNPVPPATGDGFTSPITQGYRMEPEYSVLGSQRLNLYGYVFPRARASIALKYMAGYVKQNEPQTIPVSPYKVSTHDIWLGDVGVTLADGTPLVLVTGTPATGQYAVDVNGVYLFAAADVGKQVLITYSFVPPDIEQVACELVGERYRYMDRIGIVSKALGGQETVSFSQAAMNAYTRELLVPYKQVVPV